MRKVFASLILVAIGSVVSAQTLVKDIKSTPTNVGSSPANIVQLGTAHYFAATIADTVGRELYKSDGTAAGTTLVLDIRKGELGSAPQVLTVMGNAIYFSANAAGGRELWKSDGTAAGTKIVKNIRPGGAWSTPEQMTVSGT